MNSWGNFYSHLIWLLLLFFLACCTTAATAIKGAIFCLATSRSRCCHRLGSTVEGSRVPGFLSCQLPVPGSGPEGPTQNSLTFNTASTRAQTRFAKEIFGQKSVASKNCCCCCVVLLLLLLAIIVRRVVLLLICQPRLGCRCCCCCWFGGFLLLVLQPRKMSICILRYSCNVA